MRNLFISVCFYLYFVINVHGQNTGILKGFVRDAKTG